MLDGLARRGGAPVGPGATFVAYLLGGDRQGDLDRVVAGAPGAVERQQPQQPAEALQLPDQADLISLLRSASPEDWEDAGRTHLAMEAGAVIARNQAELGWKRVFKMILRLVVKHQDRPRMIRLRDEPVEMDPRFWNAGMDVTINTGLGTGSRDRDMAMLNNILQTQSGIAQQLAGSGFADKAIDMLPKIIKTATKLAESSGIRNPDEYYPEYDENTIAQMKQALAEKAAQGDPKVQAEKEKAAAQLQIDAQKNQADIILQREKMQGEFALKQQQMAMEMQLKREQLAAELQLKRELSMTEMQMKRDVGFYSADAKASSQVHMGGRPG